MIVLIVFGLLGLVCCGGCVGCVYFGGQGAIGLGLMEGAMQRIRTNQQVSDKFGGTPTATYTASKLSLQEGSTSTVDFELSGPKGKGKCHAEFKTNDPEPTLIRVTAPDGSVIDVSGAKDPTNLDFGTPDLNMDDDEK